MDKEPGILIPLKNQNRHYFERMMNWEHSLKLPYEQRPCCLPDAGLLPVN